jgi:ATP-dependent DNA helicase DinG
MDSIVALDIETTGLEADKDAIIEIGAVRFNGKRVEGEWNSLINPGRRIPPFITQLTGITDQMVLQSPSIKEVIPELAHFCGRLPILGHNVRFDLSFLRRKNILSGNEIIDTYDLAAILLPSASRYNLGSLAQQLSVLLPATHRALDDARATRAVYLRLLEEADELPLQLIAELLQLSEPIEWGAYIPLQEILKQRSRETIAPRKVRSTAVGPLFSSLNSNYSAPLQPNTEIYPLNEDEVAAILEQGGSFSRCFPNYEYRTQQVSMLRAISNALSEGKHLMVEAGTGVGKSMAYLIPAALFALANNHRVVISTNTINLQDQLINKDIPDLITALNIDLRAVVVKGRSNYLCPRRLENLRRHGPENNDEMRVLGKVMVWLQGTTTGDRSEINLNGPSDREVWARISAEDEGCTTENCIKRTGGNCPFNIIRNSAQSAQLIIVNHALLLADVATGNRVLPEYDYLIIDEAHHLEDATTNALSYRVTQDDLEWMFRHLGGPNAGVLGWLLNATQGILAPAEYASLNNTVQRATDLAFHLENDALHFFQSLEHFLIEEREGRPLGMYSQQVRILPGTRAQPAWGEVELCWDEAMHSLKPLNEILTKLSQGISEISESLAEDDDELYGTITNLLRRYIELHDNLEALVFFPKPDQVYWAEVQPNGFRISLNTAPLHIGALMERYLWHEKTSVILTSATLTTAGEFDYLRNRLNAIDADELALGSPFDFESSTLLYLVNDIPEPNDRSGNQHAIEKSLVNLCKATGGKALVLFTSYDQLKRTSQAISSTLANHDISIFEQGEGASPHSLLETFRTSERAVLLGTRAFWEGVDVPGEALSVLVIVKLPFDVPSDPLVAARAETFDDPFNQFSLPEAILRFRQGFGRLIRTQSDRGVVAVLDKRIISKRYGKIFLDSLPQCTLQVGSASDLPRMASRWLNI